VADRDRVYLAWLHKQPCACQPCAAPPREIEANHSTVAPTFVGPAGKRLGGKRGLGQKSHDSFAFSMCRKHHHQFHNERERGFFAGWSNQEVARWQHEQSALYRDRYEAEQFAEAGETPPTRDEAGKELGIDILAGGSTDPRELAEMLGSVHGLAPAVVHDAERQLRHMKKAARA
jgi:hypothetical protein